MSILNKFGIYTRQQVSEINSQLEAIKARIANAPHLLAIARKEQWELGGYGNYDVYENQAQLYRKLPAISTAVEMLSNVGALVEVEVEKRVEGEESEDVPNHPLELLLRNPNPLQSGIEFMQDTIGYRALAGNAYWWLNRASKNAPPDEIWIIQPNQILPVPDERMYLRGYMFDNGMGDQFPLETWEVVHFKRFNPFSRFVGLSVIEALAVTALGDLGSHRYNADLYNENNARLAGILAFADPINDPDWERLKLEARDRSAKRETMMLRGVGTGGVNWMQNASTHREMEFIEGMNFSKREIWDAIAPGLSSMLDPSATEASSKTGRDTFNDFAVWPLMCTMASKINSKNGLMSAYGDEYCLKFEDIRSRDRALELQEQKQFAESHTIDEIRQEHYGDKPIGDERGKLLPVQVNAQSGGIQESPQPAKTQPAEQPVQSTPQDNAVDAQKAYIVELNKWQRAALKKGAGKVVKWDTDIIPPSVAKAITDKLPACKSENDVRLLFARYETPSKGSEIESLRVILETAIKAMQTQ